MGNNGSSARRIATCSNKKESICKSMNKIIINLAQEIYQAGKNANCYAR